MEPKVTYNYRVPSICLFSNLAVRRHHIVHEIFWGLTYYYRDKETLRTHLSPVQGKQKIITRTIVKLIIVNFSRKVKKKNIYIGSTWEKLYFLSCSFESLEGLPEYNTFFVA